MLNYDKAENQCFFVYQVAGGFNSGTISAGQELNKQPITSAGKCSDGDGGSAETVTHHATDSTYERGAGSFQQTNIGMSALS